MIDERITETTDPHGNVHTTHVISETPARRGSGMGTWAFVVILLIALAVGGYLLTQTNAAEIAKDNSVAAAADDVGEAANQVGAAVEDVAKEVTE
jgi:uncharacterized protein HemX